MTTFRCQLRLALCFAHFTTSQWWFPQQVVSDSRARILMKKEPLFPVPDGDHGRCSQAAAGTWDSGRKSRHSPDKLALFLLLIL